MAKAQLLPSGSWRCVIRRKDLGTHSATFPTEREALTWRSEKLSALYKMKGATSSAHPLEKVVKEYLESPKLRGKSPGTQAREKVAATPLLHIGGRKDGRLRQWAGFPIDLIDGMYIQDYIEERSLETCQRDEKKKVSPDSIRLEVRLLSCVMKFAIQRRYRQGNPALARQGGFDIPAGNIRDTRISPAEELALLEGAHSRITGHKRANPALYPWLEFIRSTGCRPGEAAKIELSWLNLEERYIDIPRRGTKKRNPRRVLINEEMVETLKPQLARAIALKSNFLFYSKSRKTGEMKPFQYNTGFRAIRQSVSTKIIPHTHRAELISRLHEGDSGLTDGQIALLVGDVNVASLAPYKHLRATQLRAQYEAFQVAQTVLRDAADRERTRMILKAHGVTEAKLPDHLRALLEAPPPRRMDPVLEREADERKVGRLRAEYRAKKRA
jgi:integrase